MKSKISIRKRLFSRKTIIPMDWPTVPPWHFAGRKRAEPKRVSGTAAETVEGWDLKVMSFNIRRGTAKDGKHHWVFRRMLVDDVLNEYRPDVVGLQEAMDFQIAEISAMLPGYRHVGTGTHSSGRGLHNTIFYDALRFVLSAAGTFWFSDTSDVPGSRGWGNILPRNCTWVRLIEKRSGRGVYVYNVHLDHLSRRSRKKSVHLLTQHIHGRRFPDPFVVTGDFNAREKSRPIQYLKGESPIRIGGMGKVDNPEPMIDSLRVRHPDQRRGMATFHGFNRYLIRYRIDYIFIPASVRVREAEIVMLRRQKRFPSDHFPLVAGLVVPFEPDTSDTRIH
jgi:endonuclease/exonuclease/phosphatase family metal-dependent hydrolase